MIISNSDPASVRHLLFLAKKCGFRSRLLQIQTELIVEVNHGNEGRTKPVAMNQDSSLLAFDPVAEHCSEKPSQAASTHLREKSTILDSSKVSHNIRDLRDTQLNDFSTLPRSSDNHNSLDQGTIITESFDASCKDID